MQFIESPSQEKKSHLERMLIKGGVMIFIDARRKKLQLPAHILGNPQLPLNLDYAFQIPDFNIFEDRVEASLSFNRQSFFCVIPFKTIYAIRSHVLPEVIVFPEAYGRTMNIWKENNAVLLMGRMNWKNGEAKFVCEQATEL